jgi:SAM-dependent methyltransferase
MKMGSGNDKDLVNAQYKSSKTLDTRINFHNMYSTNKMGFGPWLISNYEIKEGMKVLELGTGTADMWTGHDDLVAKCGKLILSDFSEGMLETARKNVGEHANVEYKQIDVQNIPFEDSTFDIVIANMMLYHVPDIDKAVSEIGRVLKDDGVFYSATYGEHNFNDIIAEWFGLGGENYEPNHLFTLQNGGDILGKVFADITVRRYEDSLHVTNIEDLADYLQSLKALHCIGTMERDNIIKMLSTHEEGGAINLQKEYGTFIARKKPL